MVGIGHPADGSSIRPIIERTRSTAMAFFPIVAEADARDPEVAKVYDEVRQELGFGIVPNIFKSMAIRPTLLRANWDKFRATILQGYLPRTLKEMVGILISQTNNSEYAMRVHM